VRALSGTGVEPAGSVKTGLLWKERKPSGGGKKKRNNRVRNKRDRKSKNKKVGDV